MAYMAYVSFVLKLLLFFWERLVSRKDGQLRYALILILGGANELPVLRCCIISNWGTTELQNPHLVRLCISIWHLELPEFPWIVCQGHNGFPHTSRIYMIEMDWRFDYMMSECLIYTWIRWLACWMFFLSSAKGASMAWWSPSLR